EIGRRDVTDAIGRRQPPRRRTVCGPAHGPCGLVGRVRSGARRKFPGRTLAAGRIVRSGLAHPQGAQSQTDGGILRSQSRRARESANPLQFRLRVYAHTIPATACRVPPLSRHSAEQRRKPAIELRRIAWLFLARYSSSAKSRFLGGSISKRTRGNRAFCSSRLSSPTSPSRKLCHSASMRLRSMRAGSVPLTCAAVGAASTSVI